MCVSLIHGKRHSLTKLTYKKTGYLTTRWRTDQQVVNIFNFYFAHLTPHLSLRSKANETKQTHNCARTHLTRSLRDWRILFNSFLRHSRSHSFPTIRSFCKFLNV